MSSQIQKVFFVDPTSKERIPSVVLQKDLKPAATVVQILLGRIKPSQAMKEQIIALREKLPTPEAKNRTFQVAKNSLSKTLVVGAMPFAETAFDADDPAGAYAFYDIDAVNDIYYETSEGVRWMFRRMPNTDNFIRIKVESH